jgi:hypothetical protein
VKRFCAANHAAAFSLSRNQFVRIVSEAALRDPRPLIVYANDQESATEPIELTRKAYEFLLSAVPEMMEFERRKKAGGKPSVLKRQRGASGLPKRPCERMATGGRVSIWLK